MRRFTCRCGQGVFFENTACVRCGSTLGFDFEQLNLVAVDSVDGAALLAGGDSGRRRYRHCANRLQYGVCNWLLRADDPGSLCAACRLNGVIPNLSAPGNDLLWARLEADKRRLLYDLRRLQLPIGSGDGAAHALRFEFLEDQRRNPGVLEPFVATGHVAGTITINVAEADHLARHAVQEEMGERYRTLLGHFRHESGHVVFERLVPVEGGARDEFRRLFGDERADYAAALAAYYERVAGGPARDSRWVTAYAGAHPLEDWAESWAHYLHIQDALETAAAWGVEPALAGDGDGDWIERWVALAVPLNELCRSLGAGDAYPFVLTPQVADKLRFIHRRVASAATAPGASAAGRTRS